MRILKKKLNVQVNNYDINSNPTQIIDFQDHFI